MNEIRLSAVDCDYDNRRNTWKPQRKHVYNVDEFSEG